MKVMADEWKGKEQIWIGGNLEQQLYDCPFLVPHFSSVVRWILTLDLFFDDVFSSIQSREHWIERKQEKNLAYQPNNK